MEAASLSKKFLGDSGAAAPEGSIPATAMRSTERIAQFGAVPCASCRLKTRRVFGKKRPF